MSAQDSAHHQSIINKLNSIFVRKLDPQEAKFLSIFVKQYYASASEDDLTSRELVDLYGALMSQWQLLQKRKPGEINIKVYNPCFEKDGWQSTRTVIELSHDDMPFLVDSLLMVLNRMGINIHVIFHAGGLQVSRDKKGQLVELYDPAAVPEDAVIHPEAPISIEIDRQTDTPAILGRIKTHLLDVLDDVSIAVRDFQAMKQRLRDAIETLRAETYAVDPAEVRESIDFLKWMDNDHFTFIGVGEFTQVKRDGKSIFELEESTALGLLTKQRFLDEGAYFEDLEQAQRVVNLPRPLLISKSSQMCTVHRSSHLDSIGIKHFNDAGEVVSETRFLGLYTSTAYHSSPRYIPFLRRKVELVLNRSGFSPNGHDSKALLNVLENFPRDELFQIEEDELYKISIGVLQIQERQQIRLFVRRDTYGRYYYCMVYVPRDVYNTDLRIKMQNILLRTFDGKASHYSPNFLQSVLCRIDFTIEVDPSAPEVEYDIKAIESNLLQATRDWRDELREALIESKGEHRGSKLFDQYARAFAAGYREAFLVRAAVIDISHIESVLDGKDLSMSFYRLLEEETDLIRFKLFHKNTVLPLSEVLPVLENMGIKVIDERPYEVTLASGEVVWISDFGMRVGNLLMSPDEIGEVFKEAFLHIWAGQAENDGFNQLVIRAGLNWRDIMVLRAYAKYLLQVGFPYSQSYIEDTLAENPDVACKLIDLYKIAFHPDHQDKDTVRDIESLEQQIWSMLAKVTNLDKDRILRRFVNLFQATIRTNFYQLDENGHYKSYLSIKIDCARVEGLPDPIPLYGIFLYSPRVEGIHLRGAKVARGGLRWSDRREDFRTEVLGLMKAQQVKNAVIVPLGAKGGFVCKQLRPEMTRDEFLAEGQECYRLFIRGLLDLTDNIVDGKVCPPKRVVCFDDPDPYLVVAADKGTATFSDIANGIAAEYNFWLGDAFASGGSNGYDHKKMGITAKGAWESVKRHFLGLGHDTQAEDFTVVGIGDMSGDVFGNGMLLSKHIRLVGAFNHLHIFVDPNPDAASTYKERKRLFKLARSTWEDFDATLISKGGGIFSRSAKSIPISPEMSERFGISEKALEPNKLIKYMLRSEVDLLWNGGIGTYVRASTETDHVVGDRANDAVRIAADELRCRVVGEGGNLGFTQRGRIEYALNGGEIYTDAIDNSAGVDCSDHEVNIKILLNQAITTGLITVEERNKLLTDMQDEVSRLVLANNYGQTQTLTRMAMNGIVELDNYNRLIRELERGGHLNRAIEFLPSEKELNARKAAEKGLAAPELAVLLAYTKTVVKRALLESKVSEDAYCDRFLRAEFPRVLSERFDGIMREHGLANEIITTTLTNFMVQRMGITFVHRMYDETGAPPGMIARAFMVVDEIMDASRIWSDIESLDKKIPSELQVAMMREIIKVMRRLCRWFLRNRRAGLDVAELIDNYKDKVEQIRRSLPNVICDDDLIHRDERVQGYQRQGVPKSLALEIANIPFMSACMDIIEASERFGMDLQELLEVFFSLNDLMSFSWFRDALLAKQSKGYWETLATSGMRDDLEKLQRIIAISVIENIPKSGNPQERIKEWIELYRFMVERWSNMIEGLKTGSQSMVRFMVAFRALLDLTQATTYGAKSYANREVHLAL